VTTRRPLRCRLHDGPGLTDDSMAGLVVWYSLIHIPDDEIGTVLAQFYRVLAARRPAVIGFHVGDGSALEDRGLRRPSNEGLCPSAAARPDDRVVSDAGFAVETHRTLTSAESALGRDHSRRRQQTDPRTSSVSAVRVHDRGRGPEGGE